MKFLEKFTALTCIFAMFLGNTAQVLAHGAEHGNGHEDELPEMIEELEIEADFELPSIAELLEAAESGKSLDEKYPSKEQEDFIQRLEDELQISKSEFRQVQNRVSDAKQKIVDLHDERISLQEQILNLDRNIDLSTEKLVSVIRQAVQKENEISLLLDAIEVREIALNEQEELVKDYLRLLYEEEQSVLDIDENGNVDALRMLFSDKSVGENLRDLKYFEILNHTTESLVNKLDTIQRKLRSEEKGLNLKRARLSNLQESLGKEKKQLELQKEAKETLLKQTLGQQKIYAKLLENTITEQEEALESIKKFSEDLHFFEQEIALKGSDFDLEEYDYDFNERSEALYNFHLNFADLDSDFWNDLDDGKPFIWPVEPIKGISAWFRDPGYVGVFGVRHNAVDVPAYQGTPVRAAADGVVVSWNDNGYGYSYIIIAHAGELMTLYGHMSEGFVEAGQFVAKGSIIGLSGGMPGTKGAGYMTTGPHLHFEVHLNGQYRDPLDYLPLQKLNEEQILALPEKYFVEWETAVRKEEGELLLREAREE